MRLSLIVPLFHDFIGYFSSLKKFYDRHLTEKLIVCMINTFFNLHLYDATINELRIPWKSLHMSEHYFSPLFHY